VVPLLSAALPPPQAARDRVITRASRAAKMRFFFIICILFSFDYPAAVGRQDI
jgi:hypothetical protein